MTADTGSPSDTSQSEDEDRSRRDELYEAIEEFEDGDTPDEDEVRSAFLL